MSSTLRFKVEKHGLKERILRKLYGLKSIGPISLRKKDHFQITGLQANRVITSAILVPEGQQCKMKNFIVDEGFANAEIGFQMLVVCENYAKQHHFKTIYYHALDTEVNFFLKHGYVAEGDYFDETDFVEVDPKPHLKMRKTLS